MTFNCAVASVVGPSHSATGRQCEDASRIGSSPDGKWTGVVVTDGCGSELGAQAGAEFLAIEFLGALLELAPKLNAAAAGDWIIDDVVISLAQIRKKIASDLGEPIQKYSATLVAAMVSSSGGFLVHIGDGIGTVFGRRKKTTGLHVIADSKPENGEYANQTYYLTGSDWIRHVRVTPISNPDLLVLATDGAQSLLFEGDEIFPPAFEYLLSSALKMGSDRKRAITKFLGSKEAGGISGDDKTLALIVRRDAEISKSISGKFLAKQKTIEPTKSEQSERPRTCSQKNLTSVGEKLAPQKKAERYISHLFRQELLLSLTIVFAIALITLGVLGLWYLSTLDPIELPTRTISSY
jgi:serine/threonine protein phosphatase PrpC